MSEPILSVDRLAKVYRIFPRPWDRVRELIDLPGTLDFAE